MEKIKRLKQTEASSIRHNLFTRSKDGAEGITLIALVITIIVLLILAGVAIATLTGDNGILTQAQDAKTSSDIAEVKEQAQLDIVNWTAERVKNGEDTTLDDAIVKSIIENANKDNTNKYYSELTDTSIRTKQGNEILLSDLYTKKEISASEIANSENKSKYYGAVVSNYTVDSSVRDSNIQWKVFYADENNIYLIADDYISYQYVPKGKNGSEIYINSNNYDLSFNNIVNDYEGISDVSRDEIKELNSDYFEKNYSSSESNAKAVAYMLDTAVWKSFCGENAEYAIGGPSIELFLKSYNEKYSTNYVVSAYNTGYLSGPGYHPNSDEWTGIYLVGGDPNECFALEYHDELYCVSNEDKTKAMWVASPAFGAGYTSNYNGLMRITGTDCLSIARPSGAKANWEVVARDGI